MLYVFFVAIGRLAGPFGLSLPERVLGSVFHFRFGDHHIGQLILVVGALFIFLMICILFQGKTHFTGMS